MSLRLVQENTRSGSSDNRREGGPEVASDREDEGLLKVIVTLERICY